MANAVAAAPPSMDEMDMFSHGMQMRGACSVQLSMNKSIWRID